jgi:hypothetical protein
MANQRRKKQSTIFEGPQGNVEDTIGILKLLSNTTSLYLVLRKKLNIDLSESFWDSDELVNAEDNKLSEADFTEQEVKDAVFGSYAEGAPGPDGFSFPFYQQVWELV